MIYNHSLIYIHESQTGTFPKYLVDTIYQSLVIYESRIKIYICISDSCIVKLRESFNLFNIPAETVEIVPLSVLGSTKIDIFKRESRLYTPVSMASFRDGFWVSTTKRFFYIEQLMAIYQTGSLVHLENDVMIYSRLTFPDNDKISVVKDSPNRIVPSIVFIPRLELLSDFTDYILQPRSNFLNDMQLLANYDNLSDQESKFNHLEYHFDRSSEDNLLFDGAAIGQYFGGIDSRNTGDVQKIKNFVNETCDFKLDDTYDLTRRLITTSSGNTYDQMILVKENHSSRCLANLHIHSKKLHEFSSVFDLKLEDLLTGERFASECDLILVNRINLNYHKNLTKFCSVSKILLVKDETFAKIDLSALNDALIKTDKAIPKVFLYTHLLRNFIRYILPSLKTPICLYLHNSDNELDQIDLKPLTESSNISKIYSQNANVCHLKVNLLPIGIANSMFAHGNLETLYRVMSETYYNRKVKKLYLNFSAETYFFRKNLKQAIQKSNSVLKFTPNLPFEEYLQELSTYEYSLCIRGNGIDTHRFWESVYLKVTPVIINNSSTNCDFFVRNLRKMGLNFIEIKDEKPIEIIKSLVDLINSPQGQQIKNTSSFLKLSSYF